VRRWRKRRHREREKRRYALICVDLGPRERLRGNVELTPLEFTQKALACRPFSVLLRFHKELWCITWLKEIGPMMRNNISDEGEEGERGGRKREEDRGDGPYLLK